MKKKKELTAGERFYDTLVGDPHAIIMWCKREIEAYEELIAIIEAEVKDAKAKKIRKS